MIPIPTLDQSPSRQTRQAEMATRSRAQWYHQWPSSLAQPLTGLFGRGSNTHARTAADGGSEIESPKTPRFAPNRLRIPFFSNRSSGSIEPASSTVTPERTSDGSGSSNGSPAHISTIRTYLLPPGLRAVITQPAAVAQPTRPPTRTRTPTPTSIPTPQAEGDIPVYQEESTAQAEARADTSTTERGLFVPPWRRKRRQRQQGAQTKRPKFLFCFPWPESHQIRSHMVRCFVSGLFLLLLLGIYLALSVTKNVRTSEFTILLILIIIFTTVILCHSLIRICMLRTKRTNPSGEGYFANMTGSGGYAVPREPIPVVLARDEEVAGSDGQPEQNKPPAYGLWRESVRVDPNRLFWRRNDGPPPQENSRPPGTAGSAGTTGSASAGSASAGSASAGSASAGSASAGSGPRPPSYSSDDGVSYVLEAAPRSTVSMVEVPLPPHPSELNRWPANMI